ncbi:UDP-glycosyltransferase 72E1-like [Prosopis cineraria]|uniref:UDP-glycosyltransferase 72E1-like n=1 Tax=Prosopis cineraria TaxID=364024 RepID=UPI00240FAD2A|nr:UDP-glycosyltransferase 72E1-like [Prosopis cineraria]
MAITGTNYPSVALLSSPGMGHLIPIIELGKRLLSHRFSDVTVFVVSTDFSTTQSQIIHQTSNLQPSLMNIVILPPVNISRDLGPDSPIGERIGLVMEKSLPLLRSAILSMELRPTALIVDLFSTNALAIARDLGMLTFVFFTSTAWLLAVTVYAPAMDDETLDRHLNNHEPLRIPGCKSVQFEDTLEPLLLRGQPPYEQFVQMGINISRADGILVNTWEDLEPMTLKALRDSENGLGGMIQGTVYPVGPIVRTIETERNNRDNEVLNWLDRQPPESVLYVSFGSGGTLSPTQMEEVAWGLELSKTRFVWVVRPAKEHATNGAFFNVENAGGEDSLPEGFTRRTGEVGLVVSKWASQAEILSHRSVGGFMTHCGWNSTVEGIVAGEVPMIAWPLYAEQMMNATLLTEELAVALRVKTKMEKGSVVIDRHEIQELIRRLMVEEEGQCMRAKVKELKHSAEMAISEAGSSYKSLNKLADYCGAYLFFV